MLRAMALPQACKHIPMPFCHAELCTELLAWLLKQGGGVLPQLGSADATEHRLACFWQQTQQNVCLGKQLSHVDRLMFDVINLRSQKKATRVTNEQTDEFAPKQDMTTTYATHSVV